MMPLVVAGLLIGLVLLHLWSSGIRRFWTRYPKQAITGILVFALVAMAAKYGYDEWIYDRRAAARYLAADQRTERAKDARLRESAVDYERWRLANARGDVIRSIDAFIGGYERSRCYSYINRRGTLEGFLDTTPRDSDDLWRARRQQLDDKTRWVKCIQDQTGLEAANIRQFLDGIDRKVAAFTAADTAARVVRQ